MNNCPMLAATGSNALELLPFGVILIAAGAALYFWGRKRRARRQRFLLLGIVFFGIVLVNGGGQPAVAAAPPECPPAGQASLPPASTPGPTGSPTSTPAPSGTPTPTPTPSGDVSAADIAVADWVGNCAPASSSCTFTVDLSSIGAGTTNPGAAIDWSTLAVTGVPSGYSFDPVAASTLTVHVTTQTQPASLPSYTVRDTTGASSNSATIHLPVIGTVITAPPLGTSAPGAIPWPVNSASCDADGCASSIDLSTYVKTSNPDATIDWSTLDLDPSAPGVQQSFTAPGETISFNPATQTIAFSLRYCYAAVGTTYTVSDTAGAQSTPSAVQVFGSC